MTELMLPGVRVAWMALLEQVRFERGGFIRLNQALAYVSDGQVAMLKVQTRHLQTGMYGDVSGIVVGAERIDAIFRTGRLG